MKTKLQLIFALAAFLGAGVLHAETTLVLDVAFGTRYVPPSQITVPIGERLTVRAPAMNATAGWMKDGKPLAGATDPILVIEAVSVSDAGVYVYTTPGPGIPERGSQLLMLNVGPQQRFLNLSTRAVAGKDEQTLIGGFVVSGSDAKAVLIRAVGPSLSKLGVGGFMKEPRVKVFDSAGRAYAEHDGYPAGGKAAAIAEATAKTGAFPLIAGGKDAVELLRFRAGAYTIHIDSADGSTGIVLLEVYEVP
jgi:hypothetical protein